MRGQKITPEQVERIKQVYAECENAAQTARKVGVPESTVRKYVKTDDEFAEVRAEKRTALIGTIAEELAEVQRLYLAHLKEPEVIAGTSAKDSIIVIGTAVDKEQLITGKPTERSEHVHTDDARNRLAGRLDELSSRRAARADRQSDGSRG
jgi:hypothetical protein